MPSISGNRYIFLLYDYESNYMTINAIPSRTKHQLQKVYKERVQLLKSRGLKPRLQRLDNETSQLIQEFMKQENIQYQLTPAGSHRRNIAGKTIQTVKNHFIAGLFSLPAKFPLNLWDKLLNQAEITLNLFRPSRINPSLSAYAQFHGNFDYNKTPLAPPGMEVLAHVPPEKRPSWAPHAEDGF